VLVHSSQFGVRLLGLELCLKLPGFLLDISMEKAVLRWQTHGQIR